MANQGSGGNVIAALCNIPFPGLGQLVQGRLMAAILFFVFCAVGYALWFLVVPGIVAVVIHLWAILDAATFKSND
jgi:TM2 domain-containing membrane protein YozV